MKRRVAILISGRGSNMAALIEAAKAADFPAEIAVVISNRADAGGLAIARQSGVPTLTIESKPFGKDRVAFEAVVQAALDQHRIDLVCLGGFMRLLTAEFVQRWYGRMLNIHPSLLPSFPGIDPARQALDAGVKISGATVHFVIPETDAGPIVMYPRPSPGDFMFPAAHSLTSDWRAPSLRYWPAKFHDGRKLAQRRRNQHVVATVIARRFADVALQPDFA